MIRVFISYSAEHNSKDAEELYKLLKEVNEIQIDPIFAPREPSHAEENAEKIARLIDSSHFFITFYTKGGKDNHWVNQELGYAFNHISQYGLKIIPIYDDRNDFEGFLTSQSHNFYNGFKLGDEPMECFEEVKKYLVDKYEHPIKLETAEKDRNKLILLMTNTSPKILSQGRIDIIVPRGIEPNYMNTILAKTKLLPQGRFPNMEYVEPEFIEKMEECESNSIPEPIRDKFDCVDEIGITRLTLFLRDIYGMNDYELGWHFRSDNKNWREFDFGVYVTIPFFGPTFYQGTMFSFKDEVDWVNKDAPAANVRIRLGIE